MDEVKIHETLIIWSECSSRKPMFLKIVEKETRCKIASIPEIIGSGAVSYIDVEVLDMLQWLQD